MRYINPFSFAKAETVESAYGVWRLKEFIPGKYMDALTDRSDAEPGGLLMLPEILIRPLHNHTRLQLGNSWHNILRDLTSVFFTQQCQVLTTIDLEGSMLCGEIIGTPLPIKREFPPRTRLVFVVPFSPKGDAHLTVNADNVRGENQHISLILTSGTSSALLIHVNTNEPLTLTIAQKESDPPEIKGLVLWWEDHTPAIPYTD